MSPKCRYLTVRQAAEYIGYSHHTLYTMVGERRIPFIKKHRRLRFDVQDLDTWMAKDRVPAATEL